MAIGLDNKNMIPEKRVPVKAPKNNMENKSFFFLNPLLLLEKNLTIPGPRPKEAMLWIKPGELEKDKASKEIQDILKGKKVNLEVDIIGKYVEKLGFLDSDQYKKGSKITEEFLKKHGF